MTARPALLAPTGGALTEASATEFHWRSDPSLPSTLQVSKTQNFDSPLISMPVQGLQTLQFQQLLPIRVASEPLFWRVGVTRGTEMVWSPSARFVPSLDGDYSAWKVQQDTKALREQRKLRKAAEVQAYASAREEVVAAPPNASGFTSKRETLLFLYIMLVSFIATMVLLYKVVM